MSNINTNYSIGIDLGGTKTESLLLSPDGEVLLRQRRPTPKQNGYDAIIAEVADMVSEVISLIPSEKTYSIGVGIPGSLDSTTGIVRNANSTCLIGNPLKADLEGLVAVVSLCNECF